MLGCGTYQTCYADIRLQSSYTLAMRRCPRLAKAHEGYVIVFESRTSAGLCMDSVSGVLPPSIVSNITQTFHGKISE